MRAHTITTRVPLLLSLLALGALGLVACGGGDDEGSATEAKVSADTTTDATGPPDTTTEAKLSREQVREQVQEQVQELEAKLSREQVQELKREANIKAKLSREQVQELKREANTWASLFATNVCNRYMGQPICERITCSRHGVPIENCPPVSAAFQKSFADATVEDIKSERIVLVGWSDRPLYEAAVKFSNGEVVVFVDTPPGGCPGGRCNWGIADHNRRFVEAAALRE